MTLGSALALQETSAASAAKAADGLPASKASLEEHQQKEVPMEFSCERSVKGHVGFHEIPKDGKLPKTSSAKRINSFLRHQRVGQV